MVSKKKQFKKLFNIKYSEIINLTKLLIIIISHFPFILAIEKFAEIIKICDSEIKLIIIGNNKNSSLLSDDYKIIPSEVFVNGENKSFCKKTCDMDRYINNVTIIFKEQINSCEKMFSGIINIKEIDLSNFDFSSVNNMESMFESCTNLEKINFGDINTNLVLNMKNLFYKCIKLSSIDVSKFNTSSVTNMRQMFSQCNILESLDVSNFDTSNVEDMYDLFGYCHKLTSLNISNFDTSKVKNVRM